MNAVRTLSLLVATLAMGLVTGVFWLYQHTIMPGLAKTDDRTFVGAFQNIDRAIINPWFMIFGFVGALVFTRRVQRVQVAGVEPGQGDPVRSRVPAFASLAWALVVHGRSAT